MLIVYPTNIDYLIQDVRLRIGDFEGSKFSDPVLRTSLINGVKLLQKKWGARYLVVGQSTYTDYIPEDFTDPIPSGLAFAALTEGVALIPSGLKENDVFRNPFFPFQSCFGSVLQQEDEYPIVLSAVIALSQFTLYSSWDSIGSWSDGAYSYSNITAGTILKSLLDASLKELDDYFKGTFGKTLRSDFACNRFIRE